MSKHVVASAPGKIVLCGEYAVLDGAPAICMAVDRRARASVFDIDGDVSRVTAAGYTSKVGQFESAENGIRWLDGRDLFGIVESVWRAAGLAHTNALAIDLETSGFFDPATQQKIGIGSSAAITVALCAAVEGLADAAKISTVARRAHADLQGGVGSGVDIACSLSGGLLEYRMEGASVQPLVWPEGLSYRLIWTGVAANTRDKLSKLDLRVSQPSRVRLVGASENMASAWQSGDAEQIIGQYRHYSEHLQQFGVDHDLGIFDAGHDDLRLAASAASLIYKPCGAGGGDVGIVFGTDEAMLNKFTSKLAAAHTVLDCKLTNAGAMIETARAEQV